MKTIPSTRAQAYGTGEVDDSSSDYAFRLWSKLQGKREILGGRRSRFALRSLCDRVSQKRDVGHLKQMYGIYDVAGENAVFEVASYDTDREEVVITSGREKKPVARLVPVERKGGIKFRLMKDIMPPIPSGPFEPMPEEELRLWEDGEV